MIGHMRLPKHGVLMCLAASALCAQDVKTVQRYASPAHSYLSEEAVRRAIERLAGATGLRARKAREFVRRFSPQSVQELNSPQVCAVPLLEVPVPEDRHFTMPAARPVDPPPPMPEAHLPAPPCA